VGTGPEQARRLAANEALFRSVNESVRATAERQGVDDHHYEFMCECSSASCSQRIELTLAEYEGVRERGDQFALVAGHEDEQIERVVEHHGRYAVVRKHGPGAAVADELDPRGGGTPEDA
jgi:hypothetical protein